MRAVVLAIDDVAYPTNRHAQDERWRGDVGQPSDVETLPPGVDRTSDRTADDRAVDRQPALVDLEDRDRIPGVEVPLIDDVEQSRADDGADDPPHRHRERIVLGEAGSGGPAHRDPDASQGADSGEEAVPGDLQRNATPLEE